MLAADVIQRCRGCNSTLGFCCWISQPIAASLDALSDASHEPAGAPRRRALLTIELPPTRSSRLMVRSPIFEMLPICAPILDFSNTTLEHIYPSTTLAG